MSDAMLSSQKHQKIFRHDPMGNSQPRSKQAPIVTMSSTDIQEFSLKKKRPGCTGMFWRGDPTGETKLASNDNWPRDGAKLRGKVVEVNGEKWLLTMAVLQKGKTDWEKAPQGSAMPFEYDNHYYLE
jgi:hypothetical protein